MSVIKKIAFPYDLRQGVKLDNCQPNWAVFFGADFYNLPLDSNQEVFICDTNKILDYIRKNLPNHRLIYQPHPNETDEYTKLDLQGFEVGEGALSEIFLYEHASMIDYVFSAQSGASISAFAMGFDSVVFLDFLDGALSVETITSYRSYFSGLPDDCFIKSFESPLPRRKFSVEESDNFSLKEILQAINLDQPIWILANDPSSGVRGALLAKQLRGHCPGLVVKLLIIHNRRWKFILQNKPLKQMFDKVITLFKRRVWYGLKFKNIVDAILVATLIKRLPVQSTDNFISFAHGSFEENCFLSYYPKLNKVLLIENRWYDFMYGGGSSKLPKAVWHSPAGVYLFNYLVEPLLGLYRTIYQEDRDGKVVNTLKYRLPLEKIYNQVFVLIPNV